MYIAIILRSNGNGRNSARRLCVAIILYYTVLVIIIIIIEHRRRNVSGAHGDSVTLKLNENPSTFLINYAGYAGEYKHYLILSPVVSVLIYRPFSPLKTHSFGRDLGRKTRELWRS